MTRGEHQAFDPSLYESDFYVWTQRQAAALRAMPRGAEAAALDIDHVAEEIEDMGKRDLREVGSYLARTIEHLLLLHNFESSDACGHWASEAVHFQASAIDAFTPGMRHLLDGDKIWARGRKLATSHARVSSPLPDTPVECPFTLDELLSVDFDVDAAIARMADAFDRPTSP